MTVYPDAPTIKMELLEDGSYEDFLKASYMNVLWNIAYQLARVADKLEGEAK